MIVTYERKICSHALTINESIRLIPNSYFARVSHTVVILVDCSFIVSISIEGKDYHPLFLV